MIAEEWRPIEGHPYEVSSIGRVRRTGGGRGAKVGHILKPAGSKTGHLHIGLGRKGGRHLVHRLVARAFLGPCPPLHEVMHKNDIPWENYVSNLQYGTRGENVRAAIAAGLMRPYPIYKRIPRALCKRGHDLSITARGPARGCYICKLRGAAAWKRRAREEGRYT